jgi:alpha-mannosidase
MTNTEKFSSLAMLAGRKYPDLHTAWENVLFNQFHDIVPGSSIREVYIDAAERYAKTAMIGSFELKQSLAAIAQHVNTSKIKTGTPIVVFNPLSWERNDVASYDLPEGDREDYAVFDVSGKELLSQIVKKDEYHRTILFGVKGLPSIGYSLFELRKKKPAAPTTSVLVAQNSLENEFFRITVDPDSGWIKSIIDKKNNKEVLAGYGNRLQLLEDKPAQWDAWNIGWTGVEHSTQLRSIEIGEQGPFKVSLRIKRDMLGPAFKRDYPAEGFPSSFFTQEIILYAGSDRIDFKTDVDWWEERTMLKVVFPVAVSDTMATYEIPYGSIRRSTQNITSYDKAKKEVAAHRWADLSQKEYGVSLINNSKYGYDIKGNMMRLSLLRSPKWPDPTADRGKHSIEYALYPHAGIWQKAKTVQKGYEFNYPLIVVAADNHKGKLPEMKSFISVTPSNIVLATVKKAEDSDAWILQLYDAGNEFANAQVSVPFPVKKAMISNFLEQDVTPASFENNIVKVPVKKNSVVTIKVDF